MNQENKYQSLFAILIVIAIYAVCGFAVYYNALSASFIADDYKNIVENAAVRSGKILAEPNAPRYIGNASFALNFKASALNPSSYHLVNIIIHILNAVLVFVLLRNIFLLISMPMSPAFRDIVAGVIGLIFLLHPIQTQAVTYIVQRFTSLAAFFVLISILLYVKYRTVVSHQWFYYGLSLVAALCAFKTKENTITLPLVLLMVELLLFRDKPEMRRRLLFLVPFVLLIIVVPLSFKEQMPSGAKNFGDMFAELKDITQETKTISRGQYLMTEFRVVMTYMRLMVWPAHQAFLYAYPLSVSFFELSTFGAFVCIAFLVIAAVFLLKRYAIMTFGIGWFLIFLLVESSVIPIRDVIFEHRLYLPSIGFVIAIIYGAWLILGRISRHVFIIVFCLVAVVLGYMTVQRNEVWREEVKLWKDAGEQFPQDGIIRAALASVYVKQGHYDDAINEFKNALALNEGMVKAHNNLAICYANKGMFEPAINEFLMVIRQDPKYMKAYYNLAVLYAQQGKAADSIELLNRALQENPDDASINGYLGMLYCRTSSMEKGIQYFNKALLIDPNNFDVYYNYGLCFLFSGRVAEAREKFLRAIELNPDDTENYFYIAWCYDYEKDFQNAAKYYRLFLSRSTIETSLVQKAKARLSTM